MAPERAHRELHVRDLHGHLRDAPDRDQLIERLPEVAILAPHVADVPATHATGDLRELEHLRGRGENSGIVLQPSREAERAGGHFFGDELPHARQFGVGGRALEVVAKDVTANCAMADVRRDVYRRWLTVESREKLDERKA